MNKRPLGKSGILVSPVALGCWPIAGMTSPGVNDADSLATIAAALEAGVNFLDTAYCYGEQGESEQLIAKAIAGRRDEVVIATKGGLSWGPGREQIIDGRPETIRRHCEESLRRLETDHVELYYLHSPDRTHPIAESAGALKELIDSGKTRTVGVSNVTLDEMREFAAVCPLTAYQPAYNMLQRGIESDTLPWCREHDVAVAVYWPLMKGLLTGKYQRDHQFAAEDRRLRYPMFQGEEWRKNQDFLDALRALAEETGHSVSQIVINWTLAQPGVTVALCGATRAHQIRDNAAAMEWSLDEEMLARLNLALKNRGTPAVSYRA
jgi:aryl-alcohol dehydrogenase-like predicted oxidoreductase